MTTSIPTGQRRGLRFGYHYKPQLIKKLGNGILTQDDVAPVIVQPPDSPVDHVEFGYSVAYASGKFVVGARELGDDKIGAAFLYSL